MKTVQFNLNGEARQFETWSDQLFIEALRETFKIKSVKAGCSPQRECGSCLMLMDGQPKLGEGSTRKPGLGGTTHGGGVQSRESRKSVEARSKQQGQSWR